MYEGEYKAGEKEGKGTYHYTTGDVYEGEYKAGKKEGKGSYRYPTGQVELGCYKGGADVGEAARWSKDRQTAWRMQDGKPGDEISLEDAAATAARLGLPVPA
jgi:hypothetical protein